MVFVDTHIACHNAEQAKILKPVDRYEIHDILNLLILVSTISKKLNY